MDRNLDPGAIVIYVDEHRQRHNALVTEAHGDSLGRLTNYKKNANGDVEFDEDGVFPIVESHGPVGENWPCINLSFVSGDPRKTDDYGRQLERDTTSVPYLSDSSAAGFCFFFPGEEAKADAAHKLALAEAAKRRDEGK